MFGLTKKQFLKRSATCLDETGNQALLIRELIDHETDGNMDNKEAYRKINLIINGVESVFFKYEDLNPPSKCVSLHLKILNSLITLQEVVSVNYDFINASIEGKEELAAEKLLESKILMEKFRKEFRPLTTEVDRYLNNK
jgi:hypothetical protein